MLLHPDTAHAGGPNISSQIRKMVYFRVKCQHKRWSWSQLERAHMDDMWLDLPGVIEALHRGNGLNAQDVGT